MLKGIDVSSNNGVIDWARAAAFYRDTAISSPPIAIIKVSQGLTYVNPQWAADRDAAEAAGFVVGLYHYAMPSVASGHDEAAYFLGCIGNAGGIRKGEFLALDLEDPNVPDGGDLLAYCLDFLGTLERALGIKPFLYSAHYYLSTHNCEGHPELGRYPLWYASYQATLPPTPAGWDKITIWQHDANGQVDGISGPVDLDWFYGSLADLQGYCWGYQPDPVAGKPAVGVADMDGDVQQLIKHCIDLLTNNPTPPLDTIRADLSLALTKSGLLP